MKIWLDGDNCPTLVREFLLLWSEQNKDELFIVSNREIKTKRQPCSFVHFIISGNEKDAADTYIEKESSSCDLIITKDLLLASRLIKQEKTVINDRGTVFTTMNIENRLKDRDFDMQLAAIGLAGKKGSIYSENQLLNFKKCFEKEITRLRHRMP